jgi:hypothetical protein
MPDEQRNRPRDHAVRSVLAEGGMGVKKYSIGRLAEWLILLHFAKQSYFYYYYLPQRKNLSSTES